MNYVSQSELKALIIEYQSTNVLGAKFQEVITSMAKGIANRYGYETLDHEDLIQNCFIIFLNKAHTIDVSRSSFNYLTTIFLNELRKMRRKNVSDRLTFYPDIRKTEEDE